MRVGDDPGPDPRVQRAGQPGQHRLQQRSRIVLDDAVQRRYLEVIETAAYLMVAEAIEDAAGRGAGYAAVTVAHRDERLTVTVEDDGQCRSASMTEIADRVGALGGILTVEPTWMGVEIPCG